MENWTTVLKHFKDLTPEELYAAMKLRGTVFVVEQNCAYLDADGKDPFCHHLFLYRRKQLEAYARLVPAGISYEEVSIGRVVSSPAVRGTGIGFVLMQEAIKACHRLFGHTPIRIGAQQQAHGFYLRLGFEMTELEYDEDGIPHVEMVLAAPQQSVQ